MEMKENVGYAIIGSIFNGLGHFWSGNSRYRDLKVDHWSETVYYCHNCNTYYMECLQCDNLLPLSSMPTNGQTIVKCKKCGNTTLYAGDYDMSGG